MAVPLVLLNMLIAIMGDTFDRMKEDQDKRDYQEVAQLIQSYESISSQLPCLRSKRNTQWKYIYYSKELKQEGDQEVSQWLGKVRAIKRELEKMQKKQEEWQGKTEEWQRKVEQVGYT